MNINQIKKRLDIRQYISSLKNPIICEVGVRMGGNFSNMLTENVIEAIGVDSYTDEGDYATNDLLYSQEVLDRQYEHVVKKYSSDKRVKIIRDFSLSAAKKFNDNYFDFIYLDADHTYKGISEDIKAWFPKVKDGGVLSGHDYIERKKDLGNVIIEYGVIKAVTEFRKEKKITDESFHVSEESFASFFIVK